MSLYNVPNPPQNRWLKVEGSPVKRIRFRGHNVDVVIVGQKRNESYRKVKKQVRKLQQSGALESGPMFQKFRKMARISKKGRKRNPLRYGAHQLPNKQWEIRDSHTGRVVQTVKTKSAALQAVTKWNARAGTSGSWMLGNPVSAQKQKAYDAAVKADDRFQKALEKKYGSRAGDMRYRTRDLPASIRQLAMAYQRAQEKYRTAS